MFCMQESEDPLSDPFASVESDPFTGVAATLSDSSDDEPPRKKPNRAFEPELNLTVYQIPVFNQETYKNNPYSKPTLIHKRYSAPEPTQKYHESPQCRDEPPSKPLYDLTPVRYKKNGEIAKKRGPPKGYKRKPKDDTTIRHMLSPSLTITPVNQSSPPIKFPSDTGLTITPTSNLTSMSRLPSKLHTNIPIHNMPPHSQSTIPVHAIPTNAHLQGKHAGGAASSLPTVHQIAAMQALANQNLNGLTLVQKNAILSGLLMSNAMKMTEGGLSGINELLRQMGVAQFSVPSSLTITPEVVTPPPQQRVVVPKGYEHVVLELDPEDWFPDEPYRMSYSKKKNPKWKNFPHRCEHCFKGYRIASSLVSHAGERHGSVPRDLAIPCPCCQHVSVRRKQHRRHLAAHSVKRGKLFCLYCIPPQDPSEEYKSETSRFPYDTHPQFYYASEESLRLHRKRKHPYAAMFNSHWFCTWMEGIPNS